MKKSVIYIAIIVLVVSVLSSCSEELPRQKYRHVETIDFDKSFINLNTLIEGDAHSGRKFSRADVGNNFGYGYALVLPDSLKGKAIQVNVDAWLRTGDLTNSCDIVLSCTSNDSIVLWTGCNAKEFIKNPNEWTQIKRTFEIGSNLTSKENLIINVFANNVDAKSFLDIDDLQIEYKEKELDLNKE